MMDGGLIIIAASIALFGGYICFGLQNIRNELAGIKTALCLLVKVLDDDEEAK